MTDWQLENKLLSCFFLQFFFSAFPLFFSSTWVSQSRFSSKNYSNLEIECVAGSFVRLSRTSTSRDGRRSSFSYDYQENKRAPSRDSVVVQSSNWVLLFFFRLWQSLSDRGSSSRQVSRPSSLGSSISDVRDEQLASSTGASTTQPSTPITAHPMAAAAAALASGAMTPNGDIDYKKVCTTLVLFTTESVVDDPLIGFCCFFRQFCSLFSVAFCGSSCGRTAKWRTNGYAIDCGRRTRSSPSVKTSWTTLSKW